MLFTQIATAEISICGGQKLYVAEGLKNPSFLLSKFDFFKKKLYILYKENIMNKKINSEINFSDSDFKIKIGTTNKKNPETLYIQIGTYIKPSEIKSSYVDDVMLFDKSSKYFFKDKLKTSDIYNKNFILITDVAEERINTKKKSFMEMQIHLKRNKNDKKTFKIISKELYTEYISDFVLFLKETFNKKGFEYYKTKK